MPDKNESETIVIKSENHEELVQNSKFFMATAVILFAMGIGFGILMQTIMPGGLSVNALPLVYLAYRYRTIWVTVYPDKILIAHKCLPWIKESIPLEDIIDCDIRNAPGYMRSLKSLRNSLLYVFLKNNRVYRLKEMYVTNIRYVHRELKGLIDKTGSEMKRPEPACYLCGSTGADLIRCNTCGEFVCADHRDAGDCLNSRVSNLLRRAAWCFIFCSIPFVMHIVLMAYYNVGYMEFLSLGWDSYISVVYYWDINFLTGFTIFGLGAGSLLSAYSVLTKGNNNAGNSRAGKESLGIFPNVKVLNLSIIMGLWFLVIFTEKIIYLWNMASFPVMILRSITIFEVASMQGVLITTFWISRFKSPNRNNMEKWVMRGLLIGPIVIQLASLIINLIIAFS